MAERAVVVTADVSPVYDTGAERPLTITPQGRLRVDTSGGSGAASSGEYETVAASQTNQVLGPTGAVGDYLDGVLIVPGTTSPGAVTIKDGSNAAITVFTGGATSVSSLVPFFVPLGIISVQGAWQVTTGANVTAIGVGTFA